MKKSNLFKYIFIIVIIILGIVTYSFYKKEKKESESAAAAAQETQETENVVRELRLAISQLDSINPIISHNKQVQQLSKVIFDSLVTLNENYTINYDLASEISKTDSLTYVVKLKDNAKWSDGTSVTAYDVRYTAELLKNINSVYSANIQHLIAIDIIDDQTLRLTLDAEVPFFEYNLTFPIMSSEYYKDIDFANSDKTNLPLGSGMFKIASYDSKIIKLEKNTEYWNTEKSTVLENIDINIYSTMGEVYNDFKNGNIDAIDTSQSSVSQYIGSIGFQSVEYDTRDYDYVAFNCSNTYLSSPKTRKALSYLIDKSNTVASCYGNSARVADFPLDYGNYLYQAGVIDNGYNNDAASNLLAEDGWTFRNNSWQKTNARKRYYSLSFALTINGDNALNETIANNLKQQWENSGIKVTIRKVNSERYRELLDSKTGYDAILVNMSTSFTPNINYYMGEGNNSNYTNDELNQILTEIKDVTDQNILVEKYRRILEIYNEEKPFVSIARKKNMLVYNANLTGNIKPTAYDLYMYIDKWYRKNY